MFTVLTVGMAMLAYRTFVGRLTSRAVFILMPAGTLGICVLTLLAEADNPLIPIVAMVMAGAALALATLSREPARVYRRVAHARVAAR